MQISLLLFFGGLSFCKAFQGGILVDNERKPVDDKQRQQIQDYLQAVLQTNNDINLTTIHDFNDGLVLHIEDSLAGLEEVNSAPDGQLVDLGTGGGFPGAPLALASSRDVLLVDSTKKKIDAIMGIVNELQIPRVKAYAGRIEELAQEQPGAFAVATARALSSLPSLLELAAPLLIQGGHLVAYKSDKADEEIERAILLEQKLGMKFLSCRDLVLSDGITPRSIIVFEKVAPPTVKLPRRPGMAQKRPYA